MSSIIRNKIIYVVEDSDEDFEAVRRALKKVGLSECIITRYSDGDSMLEFVIDENSLNAASRPDLILLDLNLPGVSGVEILREIRRQGRFRHVPVVIISTAESEYTLSNMIELGADRYIHKPVNFNKFVEEIGELAEYWIEYLSKKIG